MSPRRFYEAIIFESLSYKIFFKSLSASYLIFGESIVGGFEKPESLKRLEKEGENMLVSILVDQNGKNQLSDFLIYDLRHSGVYLSDIDFNKTCVDLY
jgi:hypothetical protein